MRSVSCSQRVCEFRESLGSVTSVDRRGAGDRDMTKAILCSRCRQAERVRRQRWCRGCRAEWKRERRRLLRGTGEPQPRTPATVFLDSIVSFCEHRQDAVSLEELARFLGISLKLVDAAVEELAAQRRLIVDERPANRGTGY